MSTNEIKCPHCGQWTTRNGHVDDKCHHCGESVDAHRFSREAEKKVTMELNKKKDYWQIKETDTPFQAQMKNVGNAFGWLVYYWQITLFAFVSLLIALIGIFAS